MSIINSLFFSKTKPLLIVFLYFLSVNVSYSATDIEYVFKAGDASLQHWLLPEQVPVPTDNPQTAEKIALGKKLFFDNRLSGDGTMSCASCHSPDLGWSDGLAMAKGVNGKMLRRASPTITNVAYNSLLMWDGRMRSLEQQAMAPLRSKDEMNTDIVKMIEWMKTNHEYSQSFKQIFPETGITDVNLSKVLAAFQRTILSNNTPFDNWVKGDAKAMSPQQIEGFKLFVGKANCVDCHSEPNFTDEGFHNLGLASFGDVNPDLGRYKERPLNLLKGAFKTSTLRDIETTAPYFHDGSSLTLEEVIEHYIDGGKVKTNLSPTMQKLNINNHEKEALISFMRALTSPSQQVVLPDLPAD